MKTRKELIIDLESSGTIVSERTISRELHGNGIKSFAPRKTPMLTKKHVASRLNFAKEHLEKGNEYWKTVIQFDEIKTELFGRNAGRHVWRKQGRAFGRNNTIPNVKHGGGNIMVWAYFTSHALVHSTSSVERWMALCFVKYWRRVSSRVRRVYSKNASGRANWTTTLSKQ